MEVIELPAVELFIKRHKFSPDGLTVLLKNGEERIVLVEFKSPFMKVSGGVPGYYMPQMMSGLANFRICEYALYMSTIFRKCRIDDWKYNSAYDTLFHKDVPFDNPVAMGLTMFTVPLTEEYVFGMEDYEFAYLNEEDMKESIGAAAALLQLLDFGQCGKTGMLYLLKGIESGDIAVHDTPVMIFEEFVEGVECDSPDDITHYKERVFERCREECEVAGRVPVGFLPWKAMRIDVAEIAPDKTEFAKIAMYLRHGLAVLDDINSSADPKKTYNEIFVKGFDLLSYSSESSEPSVMISDSASEIGSNRSSSESSSKEPSDSSS